MKRSFLSGIPLILVMGLLGCAQVTAREVRPPDPVQAPYRIDEQGMAIYGGEFRYLPFPPGWELLSHAENADTGIVYYRKDPGSNLARTIVVYSEEPYGYSRELDKRSAEFMERYLWDAIMTKQVLERKQVRALNGPGLRLVVEARDAVEGKKVRAEIVFAHRGERVVAFYATQWRTMDEPFDPGAFLVFGRFVESFGTLRKSFYEEL